MSAGNLKDHCFSADVCMQLSVNGHVFAIGQLGPDFVVLREPTNCPPSAGEITVTIDGEIRRWPVQLPDGILADLPRTRTTLPVASRNGSTAG
jgi:hypothetical protein